MVEVCEERIGKIGSSVLAKAANYMTELFNTMQPLHSSKTKNKRDWESNQWTLEWEDSLTEP
jgi:hypothetical protein